MIKAKISKQSIKGKVNPYARMTRHIESPVLDHADGSVTKKKLAQEVLDMFPDFDEGIIEKSENANINNITTQGIYKIGTDSYLVVSGDLEKCAQCLFNSDGNILIRQVSDKMQSEWVTLQPTVSAELSTENKTIVGAVNEIVGRMGQYILKSQYNIDNNLLKNEIALKTEETILYETIVNTPSWGNKITYTGELNPAFNTTDVFYVTLKNVDGSALENGFFKLMNYFDEYASAYDTLFYLENYDTGYGSKIKENLPIEFTALNDSVKMRDAGVWKAAYMPQTQWKLNGNKGKLRFVCDGDFIQRSPNATFCGVAGTTKNVSYYHSLNMNEFQSDSTRQLVAYHYVGQNYKTNKLYYELEVERLSDTRYATKQFVTLRYMKYGTTSFSVFTQTVNGHGAIKEPDTNIDAIQIQVAANTEGGFIRNGAVIRVTEVK